MWKLMREVSALRCPCVALYTSVGSGKLWRAFPRNILYPLICASIGEKFVFTPLPELFVELGILSNLKPSRFQSQTFSIRFLWYSRGETWR